MWSNLEMGGYRMTKEITSKEALKAAEILSTYCTDAPNNNCEEIKCSLYQWCVKGE